MILDHIVDNIILRPTINININMHTFQFNHGQNTVMTDNTGTIHNHNHDMSPTTKATANTSATTTAAASSSMYSNNTTRTASDSDAGGGHAQNGRGPPDDNGIAQNNCPPDGNGTAQQTDTTNNELAFETDGSGNIIFPPNLLGVEIKDITKDEKRIDSNLEAYKLFKSWPEGKLLAECEKDKKRKLVLEGLSDLRNKILEKSRKCAREYMSLLCFKEGLIKEDTGNYLSVRNLVSASGKTSLKTVFDETPSLLCSFLMKTFIQNFSPLEFDNWLIPKVKAWCSKAENIERPTHRPFTFKTTFEDGKPRLVKHEICKIAVKGANAALQTFMSYVYTVYGYTLVRSSNKGKDKDEGSMLVEMKYIMSLDGRLLELNELNLNNNSSANKERNVYLKINLKRFPHLVAHKELLTKDKATHARAVFDEFKLQNNNLNHHAFLFAMELKRVHAHPDAHVQTLLTRQLKLAQKVFIGQSNDQSSEHARAKFDMEKRFFKSAPSEASSNPRSDSTDDNSVAAVLAALSEASSNPRPDSTEDNSAAAILTSLNNSLQARSNEARQGLIHLLLASNNQSQLLSSSRNVVRTMRPATMREQQELSRQHQATMSSQSSLNQTEGTLPQPNAEGNRVGAAGNSLVNDVDDGLGGDGGDWDDDEESINGLGDGGASNDKESTNHHLENKSLSKLERRHQGIKESSKDWGGMMAVRAQRNQQSSGGQESSSSSSYSSSSESDSDDDVIEKRRQKLEEERKKPPSRSYSDSSSESSSDSEEDDSEDEDSGEGKNAKECAGVCNGYRCTYSGFSVLQCSHLGCRKSVHLNCQDEWELAKGINQSTEPYCASHHPENPAKEMLDSEQEDDPIPPKKKRKMAKNKNTLKVGDRIALYSLFSTDDVDYAWSSGTIVSDSETAELINKTDGECYNDVEIEWDKIVSKNGNIAYDGGVLKTDLWRSNCSEENDIELLMPTATREKRDLLATWIVGDEVNEIMKLQLQKQGIKFEVVSHSVCLSRAPLSRH